MAGELFGAPNGFMAVTDQQHTQALTNLANTEAGQMQQNMREQQRLQQALAQMGKGPSNLDPIQKMEETSQKLLDAGFYSQGSKLAEQAELMRTRQAEQQKIKAQLETQAMDHKRKQTEALMGFLSSAKDETSYHAGLMGYMALYPDEKIPPQLLQYNPDVVASMQKATKQGLEQMKREQEERKIGQKDEQQELHDKLVRFQESQRNWREKYRQDRMDTRKKIGGGDAKTPAVGNPDRNMIASAQALLDTSYPGLPRDMEFGKDARIASAAYDIASEAKAKMARNRGLSQREAMQQTLNEMEQDGQLKTETDPGLKIGGFSVTKDKTSSSYNRDGQVAAPQALPPDPKSLKSGTTYKTPKGELEWNGSKFVTPKKKAAATRVAPSAPADEEDEDGDEGGTP